MAKVTLLRFVGRGHLIAASFPFVVSARPAADSLFESERRLMARPTATEKAHLVSLICRINSAIRELESYLAEQREINQRSEGNGAALASADLRRSNDKSAMM